MWSRSIAARGFAVIADVLRTDVIDALHTRAYREPTETEFHRWLFREFEQGHEVGPREKKQRAQMLARALRKLGYEVTITVINQLAPKPA